MNKLKEMSYFDLAALKKRAAFRGEMRLEKLCFNEMERRVQLGKVTPKELEAAAYI